MLQKVIIAADTVSKLGILFPFQALSPITCSHKELSLQHPLLATTWKCQVFSSALGENSSWQSHIYRGGDGCWIHSDSCPSPSSLMESSWTIFRSREEGEVELSASWETQTLTDQDCTAFDQKISPLIGTSQVLARDKKLLLSVRPHCCLLSDILSNLKPSSAAILFALWLIKASQSSL